MADPQETRDGGMAMTRARVGCKTGDAATNRMLNYMHRCERMQPVGDTNDPEPRMFGAKMMEGSKVARLLKKVRYMKPASLLLGSGTEDDHLDETAPADRRIRHGEGILRDATLCVELCHDLAESKQGSQRHPRDISITMHATISRVSPSM